MLHFPPTQRWQTNPNEAMSRQVQHMTQCWICPLTSTQVKNRKACYINACGIIKLSSVKFKLILLHVLQTTCSSIVQFNNGYVHAHEIRDEMGF